MKRHLKRCKVCEVPLAYSRFLRWFPNGTIVGIDKGRTRLVFMEVDLLNQIIDGISEAIGFDIQRIVVEAERRIGLSFIETLMPGFYASMGVTHLHRTMALIGPPSQFIFDHVAGLGYGRFMLLSYKHRKRMTVLCRNPYNPGMLMGDSLGVWEFLEQKEGACRGEPQNGMFRINLEESGEPRTHLEGRLVPVNPVYAPGKQNYEICPGCRTPCLHRRHLRLEPGRGHHQRPAHRAPGGLHAGGLPGGRPAGAGGGTGAGDTPAGHGHHHPGGPGLLRRHRPFHLARFRAPAAGDPPAGHGDRQRPQQRRQLVLHHCWTTPPTRC